MINPGAEPEPEFTNANNSSSNIPDQERPSAGGSLMINRWPKQETLALLKIRQDMDGIFRDSNLKHPLWEEVSRKLAEIGFQRSAKKCKEKFENVNKYYKRTCKSEGSKAAALSTAGKQEGKSYRFFTQLEALQTPIHSSNSNSNTNNNIDTHAAITVVTPASITGALPTTAPIKPLPPRPPPHTASSNQHLPSQYPSANAGITTATDSHHPHPHPPACLDISESHESSSEDEEHEPADDDINGARTDSDTINPGRIRASETAARADSALPDPDRTRPSRSFKKRKRAKHSKMAILFEGLLKKILDKQEQMQARLLEALERREKDRMIREEAWRRSEMARMSRENDLRAQERSLAASRDNAIIAFLEKATGQTVKVPPHPQDSSCHRSSPSYIDALDTVPLAAEPVQSAPPLSTLIMHCQSDHEMVLDIDAAAPHQPEDHAIDPFDPNSCKRWEKPEVIALIKLHGEVHSKFNGSGPKAHLWEDISSGMAKLGYPHRSAKRCKEKWENINKYFKKACKETSKKKPRPDNAKTCPYFHELDALYKKGLLGSSGSSAPTSGKQHEGAYNPSLEHVQNLDDDDGKDNEQSSSNEGDRREENCTMNGNDSKTGAHNV